MLRRLLRLCTATMAITLCLGALEYTQASAAVPVSAQFINPVIGSANIGETKPFQWSPVPNAAMYYLSVGTSAGNGDVFASYVPSSQSSFALPPLPAGPTLWARIWTEVAGQGWFPSRDVSFTVATAQFVNPVIRSSNRGMTQPFHWSAAPNAASYYLSIGTSPGNGNVFGSFVQSTQTTYPMPPLPKGQTLWARIWAEIPGYGWYHGQDVSFTVGG